MAPIDHSGDGRPAWFLPHAYAHVANKPNSLTAQGFTRKKEEIFASFWPEQPPRLSNLYVSCPGATFNEDPQILCIVDDLILFRVCIGWPFFVSHKQCDYFIYRADPKQLSLKRLPHPEDCAFGDSEVGILPRGDDHYIIAALSPVPKTFDVFQLHLLNSETGTWTSEKLSVEKKQDEPDDYIPSNVCRLFRHYTTTVITLGGEGGTIGWVDLWRGIVFCDVLHSKHELRGVPVPLPMKHIKYNDGKRMGLKLGVASICRGITFVKGLLKFVELNVASSRIPPIDDKTRSAQYKVDSWEITAWSNTGESSSYKGWDRDYTVSASDIAYDPSLLLPIGEVALQNLHVSHPVPIMSGDEVDVVCLKARGKSEDPMPWIISLDMRNKTLQDVAKSRYQREPLFDTPYCPFSKVHESGKATTTVSEGA